MPFIKTQAALKKVLPDTVFEQLYQLATSLYYLKQGVADWVYYNLPRRDGEKKFMLIVIKSVLSHTMVGRGGLIATYQVCQNAERSKLGGCIVECGVARGGCSALMLMASHYGGGLGRRIAWLFDSFEGLPDPTTEDGVLRKPQGKDKSSWDLAKGYCLGTQEEVEDLLFNECGFSRENVHLVKGWFQDTLPEYRGRVGDIAVLRLDGDWYESTKCCMENLYDNVVDGGYVILDDYALVGCKKATDEFFGNRGEDMPDVVLDGRGGGWFKKSATRRS